MTQSLQGLRILNTRPKGQAQEFTKIITDAGGVAIECPTLEIKATPDDWVNSLPKLHTVNQAIFISANAVHYCFKALKQHRMNWSQQINVIAIGQASAKALKAYHIPVNETPNIPNSESVLTLNTLDQLNNQTVLLFKGEGGRLLIEEGLRLRGAKVYPLSVYQRVLPEINRQLIQSIWREDLVDIILLTSEQSIHNLFQIFGEEAQHWLQSKPCLVISERLVESASLLGIKKLVISHPDRMINTLFDYSKGLIHDQWQ